MHIQGIDNDLKNTIKAGGSTTRAQNVDCMDGWMGDTPWTVMTTRAPAVLKTGFWADIRIFGPKTKHTLLD